MSDRTTELTRGLMTLSAKAPVVVDAPDVIVDYTDSDRIELVLNGRRLAAPSVAALVAMLVPDRVDRTLRLPLLPRHDGSRLVLRQPPELFTERTGSVLAGAAAERAILKAEGLAPTAPGSWLPGVEMREVEHKLLEGLVAGDRWDGPLVVSMPRTGSTLLGMLFLLLRDPPGTGGWRFDRYIHEPAAPIFWQNRRVDSIDEIITDPLTPRDVIQESAYQFASKPLARWFLSQARKPIIFAVRHPQLAWPSRWRILLDMRLEQNPRDPDADRIRAALDTDDFTALGDVLTAVTPADNGWLALLSLIECCIEDGLDFAIVDNARFRQDPDRMLAQVCHRLGLPFDRHLTDWRDLSEIRERVIMGELARGEEYEHYYRRTLDSSEGIVRQDRSLLGIERFPSELRGSSDGAVTVDEAVTWYHMLIARPEAIRV